MAYIAVGVWDVMNGVVADALVRYGFVKATAEFIPGYEVSGFVWERKDGDS